VPAVRPATPVDTAALWAVVIAAEDRARHHGLGEMRLYTNEAMTENLAYYGSRGYAETHRAEQDGYRRVFFRKPIAR
jgi:hypothetical protein